MGEKIKIVVSDLHIGTGHAPGEVNPYEDFQLDDRFAEMIGYYSSGKYENHEVELILNGDFFDLLKVPVNGAFPDEITESLSMNKLKSCMDGHQQIMDTLKNFISKPGRRITYIPGNHDMDFFFEGVRHLLSMTLTGKSEDKRLRFIISSDRYDLPEGIQILHGHQYESMHSFNFEEIFLTKGLKEPILNLPWGSFFVLKVVNPFKVERPYVDAVRPFMAFIIFGLFSDFKFSVRLFFRSVYFFIKTRLFKVMNRKTYFRKLIKILRENLIFQTELEQFAERTLKTSFTTKLVIMGHTHQAMVRSYGTDKFYINIGSWVRTISLSIGTIGSTLKPTYALIEYSNGIPRAKLLEWKGEYRPFEQIE